MGVLPTTINKCGLRISHRLIHGPLGGVSIFISRLAEPLPASGNCSSKEHLLGITHKYLNRLWANPFKCLEAGLELCAINAGVADS